MSFPVSFQKLFIVEAWLGAPKGSAAYYCVAALGKYEHWLLFGIQGLRCRQIGICALLVFADWVVPESTVQRAAIQ